MSASALGDSLVTLLQAGSVLGTQAVSQNSYQVLESASDTGAVVTWVKLRSNPQSFGAPRSRDRVWTFRIEIFTKDVGDPTSLHDRQVQALDKIVTALESDDSLQASAEAVGQIEATQVPGIVRNAGGAIWLYCEVDVDLVEFVN